ncbi:MAG TPA: hypothetical protein VF411_15350 [Bacteroidia bacterium]
MNIFRRSPKKLRGKIVNKPSGISLLLPKNWNAVDIGQGSFLISADEDDELGLLMFTVTHLAMVVKGKFMNPFTQSEENINSIVEGHFTSFILEGAGEKEWAKIWDTETETYLVRLMYMCSKTNKEKEMEVILQIINSLDENLENKITDGNST